TDGGWHWLRTEEGQDWLRTEGGLDWLRTEGGQDWLRTEGGRDWLLAWLRTEGGWDWLQTEGGRDWLKTVGGRDWLQIEGGLHWLQTQGGRNWLQSPDAQDWLQTQSGWHWLHTPHGQAWQMTSAASFWATMTDFLSTLEDISEYTVIPELSSQPAFQVIHQFKSLPDFLIFPVLLALRPQDHSTSAIPEDPPDMEIIHAMTAFATFANEARERSRSASDASNYACQNWAFHLSRAPNPWDIRLKRAFKFFWDYHLLSWLERQWCLKGLRSCLVVLSEGQKLAKECLLRAPGPSQSQV
ncbi:uncharacterized protein EDB91DRAFT_448563, partial [Suillus paluster]|uniref:uncharacterized protein n=1 Tax=Suillus paluster TaxID=48578 RepID=UPI001B87E73D